MNNVPAKQSACQAQNTTCGPYPFRLGTTSCVYGNDIISNVEKLAAYVDDIELVLFETDTLSNLPSPSSLRRLDALAHEHGLTYTVHLPMDVLLGHEDEARRISSVRKAKRVMELTASLKPFGYIVHLERVSFCSSAPVNIEHWRSQCERSIHELAAFIGQPELLCIETLSYPFSDVESIVYTCGASICLDIGHVWFYGQDAGQYCARYLPRTRVVHLHGHAAGRDHVRLRSPPDKPLLDLMAQLIAQDYRGVATLEVFSENDFKCSLGSFEAAWRQASGSIAGSKNKP